MPKATKEAVVKAMKQLDICFMVTKDGEGFCSRPMSNNAQVDWDGDNWFFSNGDTRKITQIEKNPTVMLDFSGEKDWVSLRGAAQLHRDDKELFEEHWTSDIERWFPEGTDTPGLVLIQVTAEEAELFGASGEGIVSLG
ncbi:General stress protein 26 [Tsuneonella dongtanensis]|uniref:General stress protein 26 n=1 Tax=Tsuneonella dongtanensis TaxID=692370 RepID=A0A1B2AAI9_9SPHN|nr:pyridoxamine 5'-phosphate oxidase family protein [Tsuneonella dongtanensis]ANY19121.1 General stress protein 26 [Tsuneonella dongtanensis]